MGTYSVQAVRTVWTVERIATVLKLWREHRSAKEIGGCVGLSRSAVLGWLNRNGHRKPPAPPKGVSLKKEPIKRRRSIREPTPAKETTYELVDLSKHPRATTKMDPKPWELRKFGECAFPFDVGDRVYSCCGPATQHPFRYCKPHRAVMFVQGAPRVR